MGKKLYLHIGFPKAGSTSLQHFLATNYQRLLHEDYLYPLTADYYQHEWAFRYIDELSLSRKLSVRPEFGEEIVDQLRVSPCPNAIISSENLTWAPFEVDLDRLFQEIAGFETRVIAMMRPQVEFLNSMYCESVQGFERQETWTFDDFLSQVDMRMLDYARVLSLWADKVGLDSISLVAMNPDYGRSERLFREFLPLIGWPEHKTSTLDFAIEQANVSLDHDVLEVLRNVRIELGPVHERDSWLWLRQFISEAVRAKKPGRKAWFIDEEVQQTLRDKFSDCNARINSTFHVPDAEYFNCHCYDDAMVRSLTDTELRSLTEAVLDRYQREF